MTTTQEIATTSEIKPGMSLKALMNTKTVKARFEEVLGKKAAGFMSSVVTATSQNKALAKVEPLSIISAAAIAASLDLPINPSLGLAYIVPYGDKAQFQIGWKGFVQLALRSGQYETINAAKVYEGQLKKLDPFTGDMVLDAESKTSEKVVGYLLYFKLLNGYRKYFYMTAEQTFAHGKRFSKMFQRGIGQWVEDFDGASLKTVVKMGISKYGPLSIEMQKAFETDQAAIKVDGTPEFIDGEAEVFQADDEPATPAPTLTDLANQAAGTKKTTKKANDYEPGAHG